MSTREAFKRRVEIRRAVQDAFCAKNVGSDGKPLTSDASAAFAMQVTDVCKKIEAGEYDVNSAVEELCTWLRDDVGVNI